MKPYGNSRHDNLICKWGCCHGKFIRGGGYGPAAGSRRKSARQINRKLCAG